MWSSLSAQMWPLVLLGWSLLAAPATTQNVKLEDFNPQQLAEFLTVELVAQDQKPREAMYHLNEFQEVAEMDCSQRLFYLMNQTVSLRDGLTQLHTDIMGLAGIFIQLIRQLPDNSWVWLLTQSHERAVQQVQSYFFRVMALSVDQHPCMKAVVRDAVLEGVQSWKTLQVDLLAMQWHSLAFGFYRDAEDSQSTGAEESFVAGTYWLTKLQEWFQNYTNGVYQALLILENQEESAFTAGPIRLHHQDEHGSFVTYEFLRRKVFKQWAIDKGLLRGLLRHVWQPSLELEPPLAIGDFGAGGGHYSAWLNETGLVEAFAFDGTHQAAELTDGLVQEVNLVQDMTLWRRFDWILCLEVGEHVPKQYAPTLVANLKRHASKGLVMSWSDDWEGIGHVNCLSRKDFVAFVQESTGFLLDEEATEVVRQGCEIDYIARTLAVFRAPEKPR